MQAAQGYPLGGASNYVVLLRFTGVAVHGLLGRGSGHPFTGLPVLPGRGGKGPGLALSGVEQEWAGESGVPSGNDFSTTGGVGGGPRQALGCSLEMTSPMGVTLPWRCKPFVTMESHL